MNNFKWEKIGLLTDSLPQKSWSKSHMQFPAVLKLEDRIRVFFTTRPDPEPDGKNITYIRYLDIEDIESKKIIGFSDEPVIPLGGKGEFDEFGTMPGDFIRVGSKIYMFYTGWSRLQSVPYNFSIGLAVSEDNGLNFRKYSKGPVLGASVTNPFTVGSGAVIQKENLIHSFYIAGIEWLNINGKLEHTYTIKHAVSNDGISWDLTPGIAIQRKDEFEALAAPTIIEIDSVYHMWFSYRGSYDFRDGKDSYKMGYACSKDLYSWHRNDDLAGIELSEEGWDSKMICYPYIIKLDAGIFMFYNGNNFGKDSLGIAKLSL